MAYKIHIHSQSLLFNCLACGNFTINRRSIHGLIRRPIIHSPETFGFTRVLLVISILDLFVIRLANPFLPLLVLLFRA